MIPSGEAPRNGHAGLTTRPDTDRLKSGCLLVITDIYRICPYRSRAQIEAWARIEAGGQEDKSLIEAGPEQEFAVNRSRTVIDTPLDRHVCILSWLVTCLEDALFRWIVELRSPSNRVSC